MEFSCDKIRDDNITAADCDNTCEEKQRLLDEENKKRIQKQLEVEKEKNRKELEEYQKKIGYTKKFKERKPKYVEEEKSNTTKIIAASSFVLIVFAIILYFLLK